MIFRVGRVKDKQAVGPGLFFIVPCMDTITITDLRTVSFDVPPQVTLNNTLIRLFLDISKKNLKPKKNSRLKKKSREFSEKF